ncbi:hypothetical protein Pfo_020388 [Paulownia fortunei]|nr:hypothetical protein Pfo_020388 [Paulownia fortunei]
MFWQIGEGRISFFKDKWCVIPSNFVASSSNQLHGTLVRSFIFNGCWDAGKLRDICPENIAAQIELIPIVKGYGDSLIWTETSHRKFTLTLAWNLVRETQNQCGIFEQFWVQAINPTISIFLWRLMHKWLPIDEKMRKKGFELASRCYCCRNEEIFHHVFIGGPIARRVWKLFAILFKIRTPDTSDVSRMLRAWFQSSPHMCQGHIRAIIPMFILWFLWEARNDAKHRDKRMNSTVIIGKVSSRIHYLVQGKVLTHKHWKGDLFLASRLGFHFSPVKVPIPKLVVWRMPMNEWVKLNTDGASRGNPGEAGIGVLRDSQGRFIFAYYKYIGIASNVCAELHAIYIGLEYCKENGFKKIMVETDAQVALQILSSHESCNWQFQHIKTKIRNIQNELEIQMMHIFCEGNQPADWCANFACDYKASGFLPPHELHGRLRGLLKFDRLGYPSLGFEFTLMFFFCKGVVLLVFTL